ncbi:uncharacterized protein LOC143475497 [Brachyhypopomus gauderio]|uniref:uncharacterized protein LOC143475497 n=1 Tax=Brachyhypopomus gauderio TaxID=698409 RepID=UPI0040435031
MPTQAQMKRDPECAYLLCAVRETSIPGLAEEYRKTAARVWQERHAAPPRELSPIRVSVPDLYGTGTTPEGELEGDSFPRHKTVPTLEQLETDPVCASLLRSAQEQDNPEKAERLRQEVVRIWGTEYPPFSPLWVGSLEQYATEGTPEGEFGSGDSLSEEEEKDEGEEPAPSVCDASTEEEEAYPPSVCDASTVDYGGEGEDYPPSESEAATDDYGEEEGEESEDEDYLPPPVCPSHTTGEDGEYPSAEGSYTTEGEVSPPPSERSAETMKGKWTPSSDRSGDSEMDCSRGGSPVQPMEWSRRRRGRGDGDGRGPPAQPGRHVRQPRCSRRVRQPRCSRRVRQPRCALRRVRSKGWRRKVSRSACSSRPLSSPGSPPGA